MFASLKLGLHCAILLPENLNDSCGNYRSDYLVDAAVYTGVSRPIVSLIKAAGYHHKNKIE